MASSTDSTCRLGAAERRTIKELVATFSNWTAELGLTDVEAASSPTA